MSNTNVMKIGAIGVDSSHLPEFSKRIKALHDEANAARAELLELGILLLILLEIVLAWLL